MQVGGEHEALHPKKGLQLVRPPHRHHESCSVGLCTRQEHGWKRELSWRAGAVGGGALGKSLDGGASWVCIRCIHSNLPPLLPPPTLLLRTQWRMNAWTPCPGGGDGARTPCAWLEVHLRQDIPLSKAGQGRVGCGWH